MIESFLLIVELVAVILLLLAVRRKNLGKSSDLSWLFAYPVNDDEDHPKIETTKASRRA